MYLASKGQSLCQMSHSENLKYWFSEHSSSIANIYTRTTNGSIYMSIMHMYSYSNSKTCGQSCIPEYGEEWGSNAKQLLSKRLTSLVHCDNLMFDSYDSWQKCYHTAYSFIRKQWKQKVKTDHYSSPCIGHKNCNRIERKTSNISKVILFTRSPTRLNYPSESVLNNKLSRCGKARFKRWSLDNEKIVKTSQGCRQSIQKYCCSFILETTLVFYKSRSYIQW